MITEVTTGRRNRTRTSIYLPGYGNRLEDIRIRDASSYRCDRGAACGRLGTHDCVRSGTEFMIAAGTRIDRASARNEVCIQSSFGNPGCVQEVTRLAGAARA